MSGALDKEKIYEVLRNYHTHHFPTKIKNATVNDLRLEFGQMEDKIIGMILSLANGKAEYVDSSKELANFEDKLNRNLPPNQEDATRNLFASKIVQLSDLLAMAKEAGFRLRPVRGALKTTA